MCLAPSNKLQEAIMADAPDNLKCAKVGESKDGEKSMPDSFQAFKMKGSKQWQAATDLAVIKLFSAAGLPTYLASYPEWHSLLTTLWPAYKPADHTKLKEVHLIAEAKYSDSKNPFHTNPKYGVRSALPYRVGNPLSFGGVIHSTYPWLQDFSLGHVIWATGCRDMINLKQQYHGKGFFTFELMNRISVKS